MSNHMSLKPGTISAAAMTLFVLSAAPARADAIDGDWCRPDGKHMSIRGPEIVTPMGTHTRGNYDRHAFSYAVPAKEKAWQIGRAHV